MERNHGGHVQRLVEKISLRGAASESDLIVWNAPRLFCRIMVPNTLTQTYITPLRMALVRPASTRELPNRISARISTYSTMQKLHSCPDTALHVFPVVEPLDEYESVRHS
jgi:hypothetical protein